MFRAFLTHFWRILERSSCPNNLLNKTHLIFDAFLTHFWRISDAFLLWPTPFPKTPFGRCRLVGVWTLARERESLKKECKGRRRTNVQQLTCKIDLSNSFYYLFFSFVLLELKPFVFKWKVLGEKFWKSAKKCENYETILPFSCCPLVFPWKGMAPGSPQSRHCKTCRGLPRTSGGQS